MLGSLTAAARAAPCVGAARPAAPRRASRQIARAAAPEVKTEEITQAVDATLQEYQSDIEQLKESFEAEQATQQALAAPQAAAASHATAAAGAARVSSRTIGVEQADGSIMFRDLDTCCGHAMGTDAKGNVTFRFD